MIRAGSQIFVALAVGMLVSGPALAQRQSDPNMGHFYMARQQITITDDAPAVNDQRTNPAAAAAGGQGALPARPIGLPRAGWVPYSQSVPGLQTSLPKTNNGVPEKAPPPNPKAMRAKSGKLAERAPRPKPPAQASAPTVKAYDAYKQYAPDNAPAAGSAAGINSNANVRGSVLHWRARQLHHNI